MSVLRVFVLVILVTHPVWVSGQSVKNDSVKVRAIVSNFYQWYFALIENDRLDEFNPAFVRNAAGMTTLNFDAYERELKKHSFEDSFIKKKIAEYGLCVSNLNKIPYDTFLIKHKDLDEFESIECAFSNVFEWTSGMEPYRVLIIRRTDLISETLARVEVEFSIRENEPGGAAAVISLVRKKNKWLISNITF